MNKIGMKRLSWFLGVVGFVLWAGFFGRWLFVSWDDLRPKETIPVYVDAEIDQVISKVSSEADSDISEALHPPGKPWSGELSDINKKWLKWRLQVRDEIAVGKRDSIIAAYLAHLKQKKESTEQRLYVYLALVLPAFLLPWGLVRALSWVADGFNR